VAVLVLVLFATFFALRRSLGVGFHPESLRDAVERMGLWAPLIFVGIVAFRVPLLVPSYLALSVGGAIFGVLAGTLYGALGLLLTGLGAFTTARWSGSDALLTRLPVRYAGVVEVARSRLGALFVALATAHPLTPSLTALHMFAGITGMALPLFFVAAAFGCLVRAGLYAYFGRALVKGELHGVLQAGGLLVVAALLPLASPAFRAWLLQGKERAAEDRGL
jgi:uncharacterized membrane protein YdjX (TVP38/TMEM64 family)